MKKVSRNANAPTLVKEGSGNQYTMEDMGPMIVMQKDRFKA
jgi:hypothetical protein